MSRPRYETEQDLNIEWSIGVEFARRFKAEARKLPDGARYSIDLGIFREGKMVAVAEVKDRPSWRRSYRDVILGLSKVRELYSYHKMTVPAFFVVRLENVIHYAAIDQRVENWKITWAGRTDRKDSEDVEPCIHIPYEAFKAI